MLSYFLRTAINIYSFLILVYILASWVPECHQTGWYRRVHGCVEPYLSFFRRFVPRLGIIDFSPIIALLCLEAFSFVLLRVMYLLTT